MTTFQAPQRVLHAPDSVQAAWAQCQLKWDDVAAHRAVLLLAGAHNAYPWLVAQYATVKLNAQQAQIASEQLSRIETAIAMQLQYLATPRKPAKASKVASPLAVLILLILFLLAGTVLYRRITATVEDTKPRRNPVPSFGL
jgi:hypothetical protein